MRKYLVEFIGTFFLVLTIVVTVARGAGSMAPLAIGSILMVMIFAGGHISGAHYNPAVTIGVCLRGACDWKDAPGYIIAQLIGGVIAAIAGEYLVGHMTDPAGFPTDVAATKFDFLAGTIAEFLGTFALVWVVLHTATAKGTSGNSFYGLAIGFTVMACAYGLGSVSGGAFNPAVAAGVTAAGMTSMGNIGAFLVGQLLAAVAAAFLFKFVNDENAA